MVLLSAENGSRAAKPVPLLVKSGKQGVKCYVEATNAGKTNIIKYNSNQKKYFRAKVFKYDNIKAIVSGIPNLRDRALIAFLYGTGAREVEATTFRKDDLQIQRDVILPEIITAKHRKHPTRITPIYRKKESWITEPIIEWHGICRDEMLFGISTRQIRKIGRKYLNSRTHSLRHSRATHLITMFNFGIFELRFFMGWSSTEPAEVYVHLDWRSYAKKLG